ncbi:MAG: glycosyltransferase family 4 protein [Candidatus Omnitrophota bacterium]
MRILFFTIGTRVYPSSRVRVYGYLPYLEKEGVGYKIINLLSQRHTMNNLKMKKESAASFICERAVMAKQMARAVVSASRYDIVFLQKVLLPKTVLNAIGARNGRIVFDFDDAIYLSGDGSRYRFTDAVASSRAVIASSDFLAAKAVTYNKNVVVIPTSVETSRYRPKTPAGQDGPFVIVWIGTPEASKYLYGIRSVLIRLVKRYGDRITVKLIGLDEFKTGDVMTDRRIKLIRWSEGTEADEIASADAGIMPMDEDEWSLGKAGYKLVQYMAGGLPVLSSASGIAKTLVEEGVNGFLVKDEDGWFNRISFLISDRDRAGRMGLTGREKAETEYSYKANFGKFYSVLKRCAETP